MAERRLLTSLQGYFEDFEVGDRFVTRGVTMTETAIVNFSGLSGDHHPLHTNEQWAAQGPFGTRVAQGMLTISLASGLTAAMLGTGESQVIAFYGMDQVRFVGAVKIGDTIHVEGEVIALDRKDANRGVVTFGLEIKNQRGESVVVLKKKTLHKSRPAV